MSINKKRKTMSKIMKKEAKVYIEEVRGQFLRQLQLGERGCFHQHSSEKITEVAKYFNKFMKDATDIGYSKKSCNIIRQSCEFMTNIGIDIADDTMEFTHILMIEKYGFINYHLASCHSLWPVDIWKGFIQRYF